MRSFPVFLVAFFMVSIAWAQTPPAGMPSQADMKKMMQQAQGMATCMAGIDQARLEELSREAEEVGREIEALCAKGAEQEALETAIAFSREIQSDPTVRQMQVCSAGMKDAMAGFLPDFSGLADVDESTDQGICID